MPKNRNGQRHISTIIRTVDAFSMDVGGKGGRAQRSSMAKKASGGRKVRVHREVEEKDTEESVGVLVAQRREDQRRCQRPAVF